MESEALFPRHGVSMRSGAFLRVVIMLCLIAPLALFAPRGAATASPAGDAG
jgi:hypothetical protein